MATKETAGGPGKNAPLRTQCASEIIETLKGGGDGHQGTLRTGTLVGGKLVTRLDGGGIVWGKAIRIEESVKLPEIDARDKKRENSPGTSQGRGIAEKEESDVKGALQEEQRAENNAYGKKWIKKDLQTFMGKTAARGRGGGRNDGKDRPGR